MYLFLMALCFSQQFATSHAHMSNISIGPNVPDGGQMCVLCSSLYVEAAAGLLYDIAQGA